MQRGHATTAFDIQAGEKSEPVGWLNALLRNVLAFVVIGGTWAAVETGYLSNDRTPRAMWAEIERLKPKEGRAVYEANWQTHNLGHGGNPTGYWDFYNGATADTASITSQGLDVRYTSAWIGAYFRHLAFEPGKVYRVRFEAAVEGQPGAILMRNRQLDLLREQIPVTNGSFKEFTVYYATPGGRYDQVKVIFIPDPPEHVSGKMTIRKFRIEKLDG